MKPKLKIEIIGNKVTVSLAGKKDGIYSEISWQDDRDLSEKLLKRIDALLEKNRLSLRDVSKVNFFCDSPYCAKKFSRNLVLNKAIASRGKCGFTAWQVGEITAKILNFAIKK